MIKPSIQVGVHRAHQQNADADLPALTEALKPAANRMLLAVRLICPLNLL
jgi:hypothetical protein